MNWCSALKSPAYTRAHDTYREFFNSLASRKAIAPLALEDLHAELTARVLGEDECVELLKWWWAKLTSARYARACHWMFAGACAVLR